MKKIIAIILCFLFLPCFNVFADSKRDALIEEARRWLGTRYALTDGSDGPGENNYVDCSGFVMQVYKKFGYNVGRTVKDQMTQGEYIECSYNNYENLLPGDILVMNNAGHVGIYTGNGNVIHASYSKQKIVEVPIWNSGGISHGARRILPAEDAIYAGENDPGKFILTIGEKKAYVFGEIRETDVPPLIRNDKTMLPARFVAEALGAEVSYNSDENRVEITKGDKDIYIYVNSDMAETVIWNNSQKSSASFNTGAVSFIENQRTYTPVRFIAEQLDATVLWDEENQRVIIEKN